MKLFDFNKHNKTNLQKRFFGKKLWQLRLQIGFAGILIFSAAYFAVTSFAFSSTSTTAWTNTNATIAQGTMPSGLTTTVTLTPSASGTLIYNALPATSTIAGRGGASAMFTPNLATNTSTIGISPVVTGCAMGTNAVCQRGTMTIVFSQPVFNPVIHLTGFGGTNTDADFSTQLALTGSSPAGATLGSLSGGAVNMQITSGNTIRVVNNNGATSCAASGSSAGCGSIQINGTVTSLTFNVSLLFANGSGTSSASSRETFDMTVSAREDFSDAPTTNFNSAQAASHIISDLRLGSAIDEDGATTADSTTSPFAVAAGADNNGTNGDGADEDAISSFPALTTASTSYSLTVPISGASKAGMVCGWIDFNRDNSFVVTERACSSFVSGATSVVLNWNSANSNAPTGLTGGSNYVRLRAGYTIAQIQTADGKGRADSGEVEDYQIPVQAVVPDLTIAKSHTGNFVFGSPGTYSFSVGNSGNAPTAGTITVTDTLPNGLTVNGGAAGAVTPGGTNGANWTCNSNALSPQTVTCTGSTAIAVGGTSVFSLTVDVGGGTAANITNTASVSGGGETNTANDSSSDPTSVTTLSITGKVFEDVNYGGGQGRSLAASSGVVRQNARVELYNPSGNFVAAATTNAAGDYTFFNLSSGNYTIRVVNSTVTSSRSGYVAGVLPVQTYRTDAASGTAIADTNRVGGETPNLADAGNGSTTLAALTTATTTAQSITTVTLTNANISGVDFGFNFDTIVNTNNVGQGTLRQFVINSNALGNASLAQVGQTSGKEVSIFMIPRAAGYPGSRTGLVDPFSGGIATISPTSAFANISASDTYFDATTQNGATPGTPIIEINGTSAGSGSHAFYIPVGNTASNILIRGFIINRFNGSGIASIGLTATNTMIKGNYIGTNSSGTSAAANAGGGMEIGSLNAVIGGTSAADRNVISGNTGIGIFIYSGLATATVQGNYIGTAIDGSSALGNTGNGLRIANNSGSTIIGGSAAGAGNIFAYNGADGILLLSTTPKPVKTLISRNSFSQNNGLGIDLTRSTTVRDGATGNEGTMTSLYANNDIDYPVFTSIIISGGTLQVSGFVGSNPAGNSTFANDTIEIYKADSSDNNQNGPVIFGDGRNVPHGEGKIYLGTITADSLGLFNATLNVSGLALGDSITALTIDSNNNTSEFGASLVLAPDLTIAKSHTGNFTAGSTGTYTLTIGNAGTGATSGTITVSDTLPAGLSATNGALVLGGTNSADWSCSTAGNVITCTSSTAITAGANSIFTFNVNVSSNAPASVINTATVSGGSEPSANNGNNTANDPTTINSLPPNVGLVKSCSVPSDCTTAPQMPGTDLTYQIAFTNTGGKGATNIAIVDGIPANTDFKLSSATANTGTSGLAFVIEYSNDYDPLNPTLATWNYTPVSGGGSASAGYDRNVKAVRWRVTAGNLSNVAPNNTGNISFITKIR